MKKFVVKVNGKQYEVEVEELVQGQAKPVVPVSDPTPVQAHTPATVPTPAPKAQQSPSSKPAPAAQAGSGENVLSPMPGNIWKILVQVGDSVNSGDTLLILEALKMENEIPAPSSGVVKKIHVQEGAPVNSGDILVELE